jgi:hypothetical protein
MSIIPSYISGISISNNLLKKTLSALETIITGPFGVFLTSLTTALTVSPFLYLSRGICSILGKSNSFLLWFTINHFFELDKYHQLQFHLPYQCIHYKLGLFQFRVFFD